MTNTLKLWFTQKAMQKELPSDLASSQISSPQGEAFFLSILSPRVEVWQ